MDLADATLVALGEALGVSKVFTLLRRKPRVFRPWMNARRVPFEAPKERSRVCFGGFRLPARSRFGEGRPDEACGGATGFSPWGSTLDHKDFSTYRWKLKRRFKLLPPANP